MKIKTYKDRQKDRLSDKEIKYILKNFKEYSYILSSSFEMIGRYYLIRYLDSEDYERVSTLNIDLLDLSIEIKDFEDDFLDEYVDSLILNFVNVNFVHIEAILKNTVLQVAYDSFIADLEECRDKCTCMNKYITTAKAKIKDVECLNYGYLDMRLWRELEDWTCLGKYLKNVANITYVKDKKLVGYEYIIMNSGVIGLYSNKIYSKYAIIRLQELLKEQGITLVMLYQNFVVFKGLVGSITQYIKEHIIIDKIVGEIGECTDKYEKLERNLYVKKPSQKSFGELVSKYADYAMIIRY